jgi:hypothetical protein
MKLIHTNYKLNQKVRELQLTRFYINLQGVVRGKSVVNFAEHRKKTRGGSGGIAPHIR